jgi:type IV secretion system protein VirB8
MDKIILLTFEYNNLELPDDKRLINPLGFTVTSYRIDDERL